ncbi:MAG: hypothetical protein GTO55_06770, partial [Armatimonadetes bacterium]|nr:hypothetical protein [Armatimonadota bacterium]NIM67831.1 hypothetical protein [Armatimonadota bacterium]NIM76362.1 hypothetical protein [Armatimonadota bacterium]NIO97456.1 hypothetical protein [Armatimonadota bacterium]NIT31383.1 hypothetical protein [Armatimonadota bacterium]
MVIVRPRLPKAPLRGSVQAALQGELAQQEPPGNAVVDHPEDLVGLEDVQVRGQGEDDVDPSAALDRSALPALCQIRRRRARMKPVHLRSLGVMVLLAVLFTSVPAMGIESGLLGVPIGATPQELMHIYGPAMG